MVVICFCDRSFTGWKSENWRFLPQMEILIEIKQYKNWFIIFCFSSGASKNKSWKAFNNPFTCTLLLVKGWVQTGRVRIPARQLMTESVTEKFAAKLPAAWLAQIGARSARWPQADNCCSPSGVRRSLPDISHRARTASFVIIIIIHIPSWKKKLSTHKQRVSLYLRRSECGASVRKLLIWAPPLWTRTIWPANCFLWGTRPPDLRSLWIQLRAARTLRRLIQCDERP